MENDLPVDEAAVDKAEMEAILAATDASITEELQKQFNPWGGKIPQPPKGDDQATPEEGVVTPTTPDDAADTEAGDDEEEPTLAEQLSSLAEEYGYSAEDLEGYDDIEQARRDLILLDSHTRQMGAFASGQPTPPPTQAADDQFQQAPLQPIPPTQPPQSQADDAAIEAVIRDLGPDSPVAAALKQQQMMIRQQQQQFAQWQQQQQQMVQQQRQAEEERALYETMSYLQELNPQRYGSNGSYNRVQEGFLRAAINEARVLTAGLRQLNRQVPAGRQLAKRVDDGLFFLQNEKQQRLAAAKAGAARNGARLGQPSAAKRKDAVTDRPEDWKGPDEENPYLLARFHELTSS